MIDRTTFQTLPSWSEQRDQTVRTGDCDEPLMGLPGTDLDQLRRQAKDWLRRGRSGDPEAIRPAAPVAPARRRARRRSRAGCGWPTPSSRWPGRTTSPAGPSCAQHLLLVTAVAAQSASGRGAGRPGRRARPAGVPDLRRRRRRPTRPRGRAARGRTRSSARSSVYAAAATGIGDRSTAVPRRRPGGGRTRRRALPVAAAALPVLQPHPRRAARAVQPGLCPAAARGAAPTRTPATSGRAWRRRSPR